MGKGNIKTRPPGEVPEAHFSLGTGDLTIRLRRDFLMTMEDLLEGKPEKAVIDYAFEIMDTPFEEILEVSE